MPRARPEAMTKPAAADLAGSKLACELLRPPPSRFRAPTIAMRRPLQQVGLALRIEQRRRDIGQRRQRQAC